MASRFSLPARSSLPSLPRWSDRPGMRDLVRHAGGAKRAGGINGVTATASTALGVGAALAAMAGVNWYLAREAERSHPARGRILEVDRVRLHVLEQGQGSPIVLVHGNGVSAEDWRLSGVLDRLSRSHRVIAIDRPGFGYSERPRTRSWSAIRQGALLTEALLQLGVERPVLVGHSWGTLVAQAIALDGRVRPAALVLISGFYVPHPRLDVLLSSGPAIPGLGDLMRWTISPMLGRLISAPLFKRLFQPGKVTDRFKEGFSVELALRPWQVRATAADTARMIPSARALRHRLEELRLPIVIVSGSGDRIVDLEGQAETLHHEVPGSILHVIEGAGHMVHHTAPDAVAELIHTVARTTSTPVRGSIREAA